MFRFIAIKIGNLIKDRQESIREIKWNVYGKVKEVIRTDTVGTPNMEFKYDASGNRVVKIVKPLSSPITWKYTYYVRDAQGNVMATYQLKNGLEDDEEYDEDITDWLVAEYGYFPTVATFAKQNASNKDFIASLSSVLESTDGDTDIIDLYPLDSILLEEPNLALDILQAYVHEANDYIRAMDTLDRRYHNQIIDAFTSSSLATAYYEDLLNADMTSSLLNSFTDDMLDSLHIGVYNNAPSPPPARVDVLMAINHAGAFAQLATLFTQPEFAFVTKANSKVHLTANVLLSALKNPLMLQKSQILERIANYLGTVELRAYFGSSPDPLTWYPKYLLKTHGTHSVILNALSSSRPKTFISRSFRKDRDYLDETLVACQSFTTSSYIDMIRREYGQPVMEQILDDLHMSLYYQQHLSLDEHNIYGSSRLGIKEENISLYNSRFQSTSMDTITGAFVKTDETTTISELDTLYSQRVVGQKKYELSNHLGNVLAVVSDKIVYAGDTTIGADTIPRWEAHVAQAQDYYPFGMQLPDRIYSDTALAEEVVFNVTSYMKTLSNKDFKFSTQGYTKAFAADTATVDGRMKITTTALNGNVWHDYPTKIGSKYKVYVAGDPNESDSFFIKMQRRDPQALISEHLMINGVIEFEFTAISTTTRIRPRRADKTNQGTMVSYIDRIMLKEIRDTLYQDSVIMATSNGYRYGFNGHEKDDEIKGCGNHYAFGDYGYDPRLGRRWQIDPVEQIGISGYAVFNNNPNFYVDPDGESPISIFAKAALKAGLKKAAKEFVESQIKKRLVTYMGKKGAKKWATQLMDDAMTFIDHATATAWWEYAIELIPVAGDAYGAAQLGKQGYTVWKGLKRFEKIAELGAKTADKAWKGVTKFDNIIGKGAQRLEDHIKKFNDIGSHLDPDDLGGAVKEKFGLSSNGEHLQEATEALSGLGSRIEKLQHELTTNIFSDKNRELGNKVLNQAKEQYTAIKNSLENVDDAVKTYGKFE